MPPEYLKEKGPHLLSHQTFIKCPSRALQNGDWPWWEAGLGSVSYSLCDAWLTRWARHSEMTQQREGRVSEAVPGFQSKIMRLLCVQFALQARPCVTGRPVNQKQGLSSPFYQGFCGGTVTGSVPKSRLPWHAEVDFYGHQ